MKTVQKSPLQPPQLSQDVTIIKSNKIRPPQQSGSNHMPANQLTYSKSNVLSINPITTTITLQTPTMLTPPVDASRGAMSSSSSSLPMHMPLVTSKLVSSSEKSNLIMTNAPAQQPLSKSLAIGDTEDSLLRPSPITVVITSVATQKTDANPSTVISPLTILRTISSNTNPTAVQPISSSENYPTFQSIVSKLTVPTPSVTLAPIKISLASSKQPSTSNIAHDTHATIMPKLARFQQIPKDTIIKQISTQSIQSKVDFKRIVYPRGEPSLTSITTKSNPIITVQPLVTAPSTGTDQKIVFSNLFNKAIFTGAKDAILSAAAAGGNTLLMENLRSADAEYSVDAACGANANNKMVSVQISNGKILNSKGIIKLLGETTYTQSIPLDMPTQSTTMTVGERPLNIDSQSTLKNKILDNVQRSPRLQKRSQSLSDNLSANSRRKRRQSLTNLPLIDSLAAVTNHENSNDTDTPVFAQPETAGIKSIKAAKLNKKPSNSDLSTIADRSLSTICDSLFDALQCPEKLDESDKSDKSKSLSPIDTMTSLHHQSTVNSDSGGGASNQAMLKKCEEPQFHRDDPWQYVKWHAGIGYLCRSNVHFKTNEFDLIETLDENDFSRGHIDVAFQKQLNKDLNDRVASDKLPYICKICYVPSTSDLCSIECYSRFNAVPIEPYGNQCSGGFIKRARSIRKPANRTNVVSLLKTSSSTGSSGDVIVKNEKKATSMSAPPALTFNWETYLRQTCSQAAPVNLFINPFPSSANMFDVNMKVEAIDPINASMFCVCTIVEKLGYRVRLHFDGYPSKYDFWKNADSLDIFPPGWCARSGQKLQQPLRYQHRFEWVSYLFSTGAQPAPRLYFTHLNSTVSTFYFICFYHAKVAKCKIIFRLLNSFPI